jgi:hypothetical protein
MHANLSEFGGTFVERGQQGRKGLFLQETEESREDYLLINGHDPLRTFVPLDEVGGDEEVYEVQPLDFASLAAILAESGEISSDRIRAAAAIVVEEPRLLVTLYQEAVQCEDVDVGEERARARRKIFRLLCNIFAEVLRLQEPEVLNRSLRMRRVKARDGSSSATILSSLARFARSEANHGGYGHWTATRILADLGHRDVFAHYLA